MKKPQQVTGGIFYCRDSASFSVSASNKLWCNLIGNHPQSLTALTLDRYRQYEIK